MIRAALLVLFFLWVLWLQPVHVEQQTISMKLLPAMKPLNLEMDLALLIMAGMSLLVTSFISILERFAIVRENKKLKKELATLQNEVGSLRNILTTDQEIE